MQASTIYSAISISILSIFSETAQAAMDNAEGLGKGAWQF